MKFILLIILLTFISGVLRAQDPSYSQFYANPLFMNPAFTGTSERQRMVVNYRAQWPQQGEALTTYSLSYDRLLKNRKSGIGIQAYYDREPNNIINSNSAVISYSHHVMLGIETFMTLGLQAGIVHKQYDTESLIFPSGIDQITGQTSASFSNNSYDESLTYPDFAVGVAGQYRRFFWGTSIHHLTHPDESIIEGDQKGEVPVKITVQAGSRTRKLHHGLLSREFTLSPNIIYQQQGNFKQLNLGIYMIEKSFMFGGWFRNNMDTRPNAVIALVGLARKNFQFGYSFDYNLSKLSNYSYGSHEISLTFFMGAERPQIRQKSLLIPMI